MHKCIQNGNSKSWLGGMFFVRRLQVSTFKRLRIVVCDVIDVANYHWNMVCVVESFKFFKPTWEGLINQFLCYNINSLSKLIQDDIKQNRKTWRIQVQALDLHMKHFIRLIMFHNCFFINVTARKSSIRCSALRSLQQQNKTRQQVNITTGMAKLMIIL